MNIIAPASLGPKRATDFASGRDEGAEMTEHKLPSIRPASIGESFMAPLRLLALTAALLIAAPTAWAQDTDISPEEQRAILNREQGEFAQRQLEENAANQRAYEDAVKAREIEIKRQEEEYAQRQREYEEAMERWRADVAACKAGDVRRCGGQ